jgi:SHS family lactate transporter-like MFS transporter
MTIANLFLTVSFIIFGRLASVISVRKLIYIGIAGLGTSLIFSVPLIPNILSMFIGTIFYAFFTGFWPLMPLLVAQSVPHEVRGLISGLTYNIGGFVGGLGNTIIGLIANVQNLHLWVDLLGYLFISVVFISVITWPKYEIKN